MRKVCPASFAHEMSKFVKIYGVFIAGGRVPCYNHFISGFMHAGMKVPGLDGM